MLPPSRRTSASLWPVLLGVAVCGVLAACSAVAMLERATARTLYVVAPENAEATAARRDGDAPLLVGSWNMLYLGPSAQTPEEPRSPEQVAGYVADSRVAILAVQEIGQSPDLEPRRNAFLDRMLPALDEKTGGDWTYVLGSPQYSVNSMCGILWDRSRIDALTPEGIDLHPADAGSTSAHGMVMWDSLPLAVHFSHGPGRTDFSVVVVHLQSDLGGPLAPRHRELEAKGLATELERLRRTLGDDDVICVGDFNAGDSGAACLEPLLALGLVDLNAADVGTFVHGLPYDRIFVPADQDEFTRSFYVAIRSDTDAGEFEAQYSDHHLIATAVLVGTDDD